MWQCQCEELSVTPTSVMMATYKSSVICVYVMCIVYSVYSVKIAGSIETFNGSEMNETFSEYINGDDWRTTKNLILNRLVDAETLLTLTLENFDKLQHLGIKDIPLEHMPVFENVSSDHIHIMGTKIKYVPTNAFIGAKKSHIILNNNEIQSMSVRSINLPVHTLALSCNKLVSFSSTCMKDPSYINYLDLHGNQIKYIDNSLNQMTNLNALILSQNHISRIDGGAFSPSIEFLHLENNDIEQFTADMFVRREKPIRGLYLNYNKLNYLPESLLSKLMPEKIGLDGNPWHCQCLHNIERWIAEHNLSQASRYSNSNEPVCVVPVNFPNYCVPYADKELLQKYLEGRSLPKQCCGECYIIF